MNEYNKKQYSNNDPLQTIFIIVFFAVFALFLLSSVLDSLNIQPELFQVAQCIESQAMQDGVIGAEKEKWDIYSEDCKNKIMK